MINDNRNSKTAIQLRSFIPSLIIPAIILIALYFISLQNYLLFHGIVELAGIAVALCIFIIVWNTRKLITNTFFLIVGISFLFTGSFDLVHTLAYKGMGVFAGGSSDLPTQLWIAARYFQSITLLIATLFIGKSITKNRKYDTEIIIITFTLVCSLLYASIFIWQNFPPCFIDGSGLTPFKIISEYVISAILVATIIVIYLRQKAFDPEVWQLLLAALIFMILGELAFTSYISVYGSMNMLGHLFRLISVYLFYRAFVVVSLTRPYNLLFRELKENENALRESEERYRAIYDQSPIAIELYDATGALVHVNPACLNLFGVKNMQVLGSFSLFADPNINKEHKEKLQRGEIVQYQGPFDFNKVKVLNLYPTSREGIIWLDVLITPLGNRAVPITGFLVQIQDITERNQVGVNLRETNEYLNNLFDYANAPIITWDPGFHITRFNHAFERLTGRSQEEVLGVTLDFLFPDETRNASMALIQKAVSGERWETVEIPILTKDGNIRTVIWNSANVLDTEGRTISTIAQGTDITERKRAEKQITEWNEFLQTLIQTIPYPVFYKDRDGRYQECNKAFEKYFGRTAEEIIGKTVFEIFPKEIAEEYFQIDEELFSHPGMKQYNARVVTNDGLTRYAIFDKATIVNSSGDVTGLVGIISDITERKKAEDALRESEEKYRSIFNNFLDLYYRTDLDGIITVLSPSLKKLSGWAPDELIGHPATELYPFPEERVGLMKTLFQTGAVQDYEITLLHKDGRHIRTSISCRLVLDNAGKPSEVEGTIRNITERKVFEETLRESEERHRMLFDSSWDAMMTLVPPSWKFASGNPAAVKMFGTRNIEEFTGLGPWDVSPEQQPDGSNSAKKSQEMLEAALHEGYCFFEWTQKRVNGEEFPATVLLTKMEMTGQVFVEATVRDITVQKRAEEALRVSEEKYRALTENTPDLLFSADMDGIITYISPQINQYGYLEKDLIGHLFFDFIHPEDRQAIIESITTELKKNYRFNATFRMLDNWQDSHWFEENCILRLDPFGKPIGIYGVLRDITERKRAEQAILEGTKKLNILNSITRHDILNQITALGMLLNMLGERVPDNTAQVFIAKSQEVTDRITRQIEFTKEYQDIGVLSPRWQNVFDLMTDSKNLLISCPFDISIETGTLEVYADPLLVKVFYNLLENSVRHGEMVTRVRFFTRESDAGLTLIYEDNGAGIDAASKKNLFQRGFGKHTGFGLYMMREILAITGIMIEENGEPGKGARFEIFVPNGSYRQSGPA